MCRTQDGSGVGDTDYHGKKGALRGRQGGVRLGGRQDIPDVPPELWAKKGQGNPRRTGILAKG